MTFSWQFECKRVRGNNSGVCSSWMQNVNIVISVFFIILPGMSALSPFEASLVKVSEGRVFSFPGTSLTTGSIVAWSVSATSSAIFSPSAALKPSATFPFAVLEPPAVTFPFAVLEPPAAVADEAFWLSVSEK